MHDYCIIVLCIVIAIPIGARGKYTFVVITTGSEQILSTYFCSKLSDSEGSLKELYLNLYAHNYFL